MALQTGVSTSKVLILAGAGLTGSIVLRSGRLSELISQLQELLKGVSESEVAPQKYDSAFLAAQIRQLSQEIKDLTLSRPVTILNGDSYSSGGYTSYLVPAAAIGAIGYCYMWLKGWSLSDVMFVTKHNMANAVASVTKQLDNVSATLTATKQHLSRKLERLDWKVEEQLETSKLIAKDVNDMNVNLSQIGFDIEMIHHMIASLEGKLELLEGKQDIANSGLLYLCQVAGGFKDAFSAKPIQEASTKLVDQLSLTYEDKSPKGLQFLADASESGDNEKSVILAKKGDTTVNLLDEKGSTTKTRIHRSHPIGFSLVQDLLKSDK